MSSKEAQGGEGLARDAALHLQEPEQQMPVDQVTMFHGERFFVSSYDCLVGARCVQSVNIALFSLWTRVLNMLRVLRIQGQLVGVFVASLVHKL